LGDIKRCILLGQLGMIRHHLDGVALSELGEDVNQLALHLVGLVHVVEDMDVVHLDAGSQVGDFPLTNYWRVH
jgi:hypothetical protein